MKVTAIIEKKDNKGTYAGVRFDDDTNDSIKKYIEDNDIPNGISPKDFHTTLLYSRKFLPDYEPEGVYSQPMIGKPVGFEKWSTQPDDNGKVSACLVLRYDCDQLTSRHEALMQEHEATYDYPEYKPHITLSYDIGSLQVKDLPKFDSELKIVKEYSEELDVDRNYNK